MTRNGTYRQNRGGYRLNNRGRFLFLSLLFVSLLLFQQISFRSGVNASDCQDTYQLIAVQPGDTLWQIAADRTSSAGQDLRVVVRQIKLMNGMITSSLQIGQVLKVPL